MTVDTHGVLFISSMALLTRDALHVRIYIEGVKISGLCDWVQTDKATTRHEIGMKIRRQDRTSTKWKWMLYSMLFSLPWSFMKHTGQKYSVKHSQKIVSQWVEEHLCINTTVYCKEIEYTMIP